jgi:hypothetical protein
MTVLTTTLLLNIQKAPAAEITSSVLCGLHVLPGVRAFGTAPSRGYTEHAPIDDTFSCIMTSRSQSWPCGLLSLSDHGLLDHTCICLIQGQEAQWGRNTGGRIFSDESVTTEDLNRFSSSDCIRKQRCYCISSAPAGQAQSGRDQHGRFEGSSKQKATVYAFIL